MVVGSRDLAVKMHKSTNPHDAIRGRTITHTGKDEGGAINGTTRG